MVTISKALAIATEHHQAGRLQTAEQIYRQILQADPNQVDAIHLLGVMASQLGRHEVAVQYIARAIGLKGDTAAFHNNLGEAYRALHRLSDAIACYRQALVLEPDFVNAHYNLGNALCDLGTPDEAIACYRRALELKPDFAEAQNNLGYAFNNLGQTDQAIACFRRALELKPTLAEAHNSLGNALKDQGDLDQAVACYRRALELMPGFAAAHLNLGNALKDQGNLDQAIACFRRARELTPGLAESHINLGNALKHQGKLDEAIACYHEALQLRPDAPEIHYNLGGVFRDQGKSDEAIACYRRALQLKPDDAQAYNNLGIALGDRGRPDEAIACYRRALEIQPDYAEAYNNLGNALKDQGMLEEALACFRRALELKPDFVDAHSNLVYTHVFCPGYDPQTLYDEHRLWNQRHATPLGKSIAPHRNDRSADRRLRVGYVSPDFRSHVVGRNLLPLFREHDHQRFEILCYADVACPDELTGRFRSYADAWCDTAGLTDEKLAQRIRDDRIDILVDLTLHMARNRLLVFARKPAPVQVTFAGYPGTTGLTTIDYRLTDPYLDPPGLYDRYYSEESIRLPDAFWCYDRLESEPAVNRLPAAEKGYVSFGCLNNFCKVNPFVLKIWARVLLAVEGSRLTIQAGEGTHRRQTLDLLAEEGVARDRVTFVGGRPRRDYLGLYHDIDIGLDTVPYNGHTTSLDAFWMGVPVVTLVGPTVVGRAGLCQLMNLGLPELIATSPDLYVQIATQLAQDLPRLSRLRATLRDRMQASPLTAAPRFARSVEAAYRTMWRRWCTVKPARV